MSCSRFEEEISLAQAGLLEPARRAALDEHLGSCASCRATGDRLALALRTLDSTPPMPAPRGFAGDTWKLIAGRTAPAAPSLSDWLARVFSRGFGPALAAGLAAAAVVAVVLWPRHVPGPIAVAPAPSATPESGSSTPDVQVLAQTGTTTSVHDGVRRRLTLTLPDPGCRVVVAHAGRARYTLERAGSTIELSTSGPVSASLRSGEARVEVARGENPYELVTDGARITVLGTLFDVTAGVAGRVTLHQGRLRVTSDPALPGAWAAPGSTGRTVVLEAGQVLSWTAGGRAAVTGLATGRSPAAVRPSPVPSRSPSPLAVAVEPPPPAGPSPEVQTGPDPSRSPDGMSGQPLPGGGNQNLNDVFGPGR